MSEADPHTWYVTACAACAKPLKVLGRPPPIPLCLHCDIIRAAPEEIRERIRKTLAALPIDAPLIDDPHDSQETTDGPTEQTR